ncbi:hypothetical protein [Hoeflea sp. TYP-13]|uniref:hypothetical protein n=1 Tax=Hoeflea sp. TYP-13 TaxID=3230023 RepID=UPI0034C5FB07
MAVNAHEERARNLARLAALQKQLQKLAEADLAETTRQREELRGQIEHLLEVMSGLSELHRLFPHLYARQLGTLRSREQTLIGQAQLQEQKIVRERTKNERIGEHLADAKGEAERYQEDEALLDLLELVKRPAP